MARKKGSENYPVELKREPIRQITRRERHAFGCAQDRAGPYALTREDC